MMYPNILACPCCLSVAGLTNHPTTHLYWITCVGCGLATRSGGRAEVIGLWNLRPTGNPHAADAALTGLRSMRHADVRRARERG